MVRKVGSQPTVCTVLFGSSWPLYIYIATSLLHNVYKIRRKRNNAQPLRTICIRVQHGDLENLENENKKQEIENNKYR